MTTLSFRRVFVFKLHLKFFQLSPEDVVWLELYETSDLKIYFMNPGEEVFVPMFIWPHMIDVREQRLSQRNEYTQIRLTKESNMRKNDACNATDTYIYGGKIFYSKRYVILL